MNKFEINVFIMLFIALFLKLTFMSYDQNKRKDVGV